MKPAKVWPMPWWCSSRLPGAPIQKILYTGFCGAEAIRCAEIQGLKVKLLAFEFLKAN